jgi:hypothetical protein
MVGRVVVLPLHGEHPDPEAHDHQGADLDDEGDR